jgi:hypothetical protein
MASQRKKLPLKAASAQQVQRAVGLGLSLAKVQLDATEQAMRTSLALGAGLARANLKLAGLLTSPWRR